jgi:HD-GYP domain-containing protein (c-di-GMP phosphodiesterase class II)
VGDEAMKKIMPLFRSFRWKVTFILVILMFFSGAVSNFLVYEYSARNQLQQLREKLMVIAGAVTLTVDADDILRIPLDKEGVKSPQYNALESELLKIKRIAPSLAYVYILRKSQKKGVLRFVIDLHPGQYKEKRPTAYPGDAYDASRFPELLESFNGPSADKKLVTDEWGVFLSGYAPIRDSEGKAVAVLGIDMSADDVYNLQREVRIRSMLVLALGIILSLMLGMSISARVTAPIKKLVDGTRHISSGDLRYQVNVGGGDEISELASSFNHMAESLYKARKKLVGFFYRAVQSLVRVLEARDPYTKGHSDRVTDFSVRIAHELKLPKEKIEILKEGSLLHDIGKLGVQEMILNKKSGLSEDERKAISKHPAIGEDILKPVSHDKELLTIVRGHHERYDGKGYPDGLSGNDINILASIVAAADSYDAMTSQRAYRKDLTKYEAIEQLAKNSGTQFNPAVVDAFIRVLKNSTS